MNTYKNIPVLPLRNAVAFPDVVMPFLVRRASGIATVKAAQARGGLLIAVAQRGPGEQEPAEEDLYRTGTLLKIEKVAGSEAKGFQVVVRGLARFKIDEFFRDDDHWAARGEIWGDAISPNTDTIDALFKTLKEMANEILNLIPGDTQPISEMLEQVEEPSHLTHLCAANLELSVEQRQELLEQVDLKTRLLALLDLMRTRRETLTIQSEIRTKMSERLDKYQRDAILREQMKTIRDQLGDEDESGSEKLSDRVEKAGMPPDVRKVAEQELKRLEQAGPSSPETNIIRNYIEWLCNMPWQKESVSKLEDIDLDQAQAILDEDHFGLDKIKKRILQHLAVMKLKKEGQGTILCFVGPPGVGKTSLGQSIAKVLGRKFVRASLGGLRDDAEIRGHRRTYIGALPGKIIQGIKRAGENDSVFLLDEIDKLANAHYGDPASAMLEVLDPEQNKNFMDNYLDVPFDLSKVFFIATANTLDTIPAPLLDRLEVIQLSGYTTTEKLNIAKKHLVPKQLKQAGLMDEQVRISDDAITQVIVSYTREAGVRELQRRISTLCRMAAERVIRGKHTGPVEIDASWLDEAFGTERYTPEVADHQTPPGVVTGLAWTPQGGEILFIEATSMPGKGGLILTGQLGDVMKESMQIAMSLVRSNLTSLAPSFEFDKKDVHIHVPSGAIPKDGPSAGIAIMTAIASLFSGKSADHELAMTGEITLRGAVMPVGGIKEKVMGAHRAGIKRIILSQRNQKDLRDVPEEVKSQIHFDFVDTAADVLKLALGLRVVNDIPSPALFQEPPSGGKGQGPLPSSVAVA